MSSSFPKKEDSCPRCSYHAILNIPQAPLPSANRCSPVAPILGTSVASLTLLPPTNRHSPAALVLGVSVVYQFLHHSFLRHLTDIVHLSKPRHLVFCLQLFRQVLRLRHFRHYPLYSVLCLFLRLHQMFIQFSLRQQAYEHPVTVFLQVVPAERAVLSNVCFGFVRHFQIR